MGPSCTDVAMFTLPERLHIDRRADARARGPAAAPAKRAPAGLYSSASSADGAAAAEALPAARCGTRDPSAAGLSQTGSSAPALAAAAAARSRPRVGEAASCPGAQLREEARHSHPALAPRTAPRGDPGQTKATTRVHLSAARPGAAPSSSRCLPRISPLPRPLAPTFSTKENTWLPRRQTPGPPTLITFFSENVSLSGLQSISTH